MPKTSEERLHVMRHSLAHVMAAAIQRLWPATKFGVGPVVEDGFYYDVDPGTTISEEDLPKIETVMREIIKQDIPIRKTVKGIDEALAWAKRTDQPFKMELLNDLKRAGTTTAKDIDPEQLGLSSITAKVSSVTFYGCGPFIDLCRGPHVTSSGKVGPFKLHKVAGAYWRGKDTNPQVQRIYGMAFTTEKELQEHITQLEEARKRDHRVLGKQLDLFVFSEMVGSGLPMFTERGTWLRELLGRYSQQLRQDKGFRRVWTPHITKTELYKKSGHWEKFGEELLLVKSQETSDELVMKPMNCPHHVQIYQSRPRSYKELPIKMMENTTDYRDEKSGELHGLSRVRSITQDDSHVFCLPDQIEAVAGELIDATQQLYATIGMELKIELSFRDESDAYLGDQKLWDAAQKQLQTVADHYKLEYETIKGEAAFYGPKIDFKAIDAIGRSWQVATVQLDFVQPGRFEMQYAAEDGSLQIPVMVHCALLGSIERFLGVYIEHTAGHFPFWLAPEQIRILTVNETVTPYVASIAEILSSRVIHQPLRHNEIRFSVDDRNESLGRKIHEAADMKIPLLLIIGPRDMAESTISVRALDKEFKIKFDAQADELIQLLESQNG